MKKLHRYKINETHLFVLAFVHIHIMMTEEILKHVNLPLPFVKQLIISSKFPS